MLAVIGAGCPAGLMAAKLTKRADMALAISVTVVLQLANVAAAPLWANAVVSGASISPWIIIKDMCFLVLIPLAVGIVVRARYASTRSPGKTELDRIANIALIALFAFGFAAYWHIVVDQLGSWVVIVSIITTLVPAALGNHLHAAAS